MKPNPRILAAPVILLAAAALAWVIWRPNPADQDLLSGYIEGEALYFSAPVAGPVERVAVARGQRVQAGDPLFAMDARTLNATQAQAGARVAQSDAAVAQARASLAQLRADADAAGSAAATAARDAARYNTLEQSGAVSRQEADRARGVAETSAAQARAARERLSVAAAAISEAGAGASQARAGLTETQVRIDQLAPRAPTAAVVEEVYFQTGEWAAANQPVVSLLPDDKVKLRFFVPETEAALYRPGTVVRFGCDSCPEGLTATIAYVSPRPEFTPPVIYSRKTRDRLVFLVEARPARPQGLAPGLPIDVVPLGRRP